MEFDEFTLVMPADDEAERALAEHECGTASCTLHLECDPDGVPICIQRFDLAGDDEALAPFPVAMIISPATVTVLAPHDAVDVPSTLRKHGSTKRVLVVASSEVSLESWIKMETVIGPDGYTFLKYPIGNDPPLDAAAGAAQRIPVAAEDLLTPLQPDERRALLAAAAHAPATTGTRRVGRKRLESTTIVATVEDFTTRTEFVFNRQTMNRPS
jgi:hypothetical protein